MARFVDTAARFLRLAFWPLCAAVLVVLALQPIYVLALDSVGALVSRERIVAHLRAAFDQGIIAADGTPKSLLWKGGEQVTECISVGIGLDAAESPWRTAVSGAYPMVDETHQCNGLYHAVNAEPAAWRPYFRYWHGYRVILAPLVALFPFWFVKLLNALMVAAACATLWITLRNRAGVAVATITLASFVFLSDVLFIWRTSTHSISLAYILAGTCLFAAAITRNWSAGRLIVLAAVLGSVFNFIDFFINPPMMPMLLAFFVLLDGRRDAGLIALASVIAWYGGDAETWLGRWLFAYIAMPQSAGVIDNILYSAQARSFGSATGVYLYPLAATLRTYLRALHRVGVIVPALIAVAVAHYSATVSRIDWGRALWLSTPLLATVLWFEALSSQTQFHLTVSARSAAMGGALALAAIVLSIPQRPSLADLRAHLDMMATALRRRLKRP